jgi:hypothetical protein
VVDIDAKFDHWKSSWEKDKAIDRMKFTDRSFGISNIGRRGGQILNRRLPNILA